MIGEVWLAGGQSNMELELQNSLNGKEVLANIKDVNVRFYYTKKNAYIDEFFYASPDYKPTFPEAQNLSLEQADIIQNVLYSNVMYDDEQVALLAKKVEKVLDVVNKQPSDVAFLTTVLHDYQYYALRII